MSVSKVWIAARLQVAGVVAAAFTLVAAPTFAADHHAGYYYPSPTTEIYVSRAQTLAGAAREGRIAFVIALTGEQLSRGYPPQYAIFAKGDAADKMIIVALNDGAIASLYQARALLAQLTAVARASQFLRRLAVEDVFTFFDMAKLLGFTRITISDGKSYAHQVALR